MITVIIAGGSGTRLWPLSTPDYPKHLISLTGHQSLLQYTYLRAKTLSKDVYVVTDASHANHVKKQLSDLDNKAFIVEPGRRGTASCIVAALSRISENHGTDEPIAFVAADHYVRDTAGFTHSFKVAAKASQKAKRIVLIGVEPNYPATGFGYIQKDGIFDEESFVFNVDSFKEKPDYDTARKYVTSGNYLWNCSYFVGSIDTFVATMQIAAPDLYDNFQALQATKTGKAFNETYLGFKNVSIDYALIEKAKDLLVAPAAFDWMDLGSFGDLHKAVESDKAGNHLSGGNIELEDVENSYIRNDDGRPVAVIGLDNVAVINTPNGILVTRKDLAQKVGDVSKRFKKEAA
jgi:mannose-1-phosphate guanylyltransferase/mannose-6-phosphate isomerase